MHAADSRADKQFTFTTDSRGGYPSISPDSPAAKLKEESRRLDNEERDRQASESTRDLTPPAPQQQAGRAADETRGREVRTQIDGGEKDPILRQQGIDELRYGQSAGQTSNIPGTTGTSPNGTSNLFGTEGVPQFPRDRFK